MKFIDHDEPEVDPSRDLLRERYIKTNNVLYTLKAEDPYGFWKIYIDKGRLPETLLGVFTSYEYAKAALENHLESKRKLNHEVTP